MPNAALSAVLDAHRLTRISVAWASTRAARCFATSRVRKARRVINEEASNSISAECRRWGRHRQRGPPHEIVGVIQPGVLRASARRIEPSIYFPMTQDFLPRMTLILGARKADEAVLSPVRRGSAVGGGTVTPGGVTTLEEHLTRTALAPERIARCWLARRHDCTATGVLGVYGAMAEFTRPRRREFALRIALGAQRWRVIAQVLGAGARPAAAGIMAGAGTISWRDGSLESHRMPALRQAWCGSADRSCSWQRWRWQA
jgi:hypothetical protein